MVSNFGLPMKASWNKEHPIELRCDAGDCPRGMKSLAEQPAYAPYDDCVAIHAEMMVLAYYLEKDLTGWRLYVTDKPCDDCAANKIGRASCREGEEIAVVADGLKRKENEDMRRTERSNR